MARRRRKKKRKMINYPKEQELGFIEVNGQHLTPEEYEEYKEQRFKENFSKLEFIINPEYQTMKGNEVIECSKAYLYLSYPNCVPVFCMGDGKFLSEYSSAPISLKQVVLVHRKNVDKAWWKSYTYKRRKLLK